MRTTTNYISSQNLGVRLCTVHACGMRKGNAAAAIAAGAAALLLEWGVVRGNRPTMGTQEIKQLLIRGARRNPNELYPNRSWGYGALNLYNSFQLLGRFQ